jgi:hypothetical protein
MVRKNIAGQTTVPFFFRVVIFLGCNWCSYFDTSTNYGTYIRAEKKYYQKKKVQSSGRPCFLAGSNYNQKKLRPEKNKGTVIWPMFEINLRQPSVVSKYEHQLLQNWKKLQLEKKGTVVWSSVGAQNTKHNTHRHSNQQDEPCHPTLQRLCPLSLHG